MNQMTPFFQSIIVLIYQHQFLHLAREVADASTTNFRKNNCGGHVHRLVLTENTVEPHSVQTRLRAYM